MSAYTDPATTLVALERGPRHHRWFFYRDWLELRASSRRQRYLLHDPCGSSRCYLPTDRTAVNPDPAVTAKFGQARVWEYVPPDQWAQWDCEYLTPEELADYDRSAVNIRIEGTRGEVAVVVAILQQVLDVQQRSAFHANGQDTFLGRAYLTVAAPMTSDAHAEAERIAEHNRTKPAAGRETTS